MHRDHLTILKQGVKTWNKWRRENYDLEIHLRNAEFPEVDLSIIDLREANLSGSSLRGFTLVRANFLGADLNGVDFREANLEGANLYKANLRGANLSKANLKSANLFGADLSEAYLFETDLSGSKLNGANLRGTYIGQTRFNSIDFSQTMGLDEIEYMEPCFIGIDTFRLSKGKLPAVFLRGCGLSDADIEYTKLSNPELSNEEITRILYKIHDLRASQSVQISPLFISYSQGDGIFVDKLENYLYKIGIRFWRDVHDGKAGRLEKQIDRAIRQHPIVLLVLSRNSLQSDWVEHEVRMARQLEKETGRDVLCPVTLDKSWVSSPWPKRVMEQIMEYNILDFSAWKDDVKFEGMFRKLIDGLELFYKDKAHGE